MWFRVSTLFVVVFSSPTPSLFSLVVYFSSLLLSLSVWMATTTGLRKLLDDNNSRPTEWLASEIGLYARKQKMSCAALRKFHQDLIAKQDEGSDQEQPLTSIDQISSAIAKASKRPSPADDANDNTRPVSVQQLDTRLEALHTRLATEMHSSLKEMVSQLLLAFDSRVKDVEVKVRGLEHEVETQGSQIEQLRKKTADLEAENAALREKLDQDSRATNLIVEGISTATQSKESAEKAVESLISQKLGIDGVKPVEVRRLRRPRDEGGTVRLLVRLQSIDDKITILRSCRALKDHPRIRVWEDLTPQQQKRRRLQLPTLHHLRRAKKKAWFRGDRLYVIDEEGAPPRLVLPRDNQDRNTARDTAAELPA